MKWLVLITFFNAQGILTVQEAEVPGTGDHAWCDHQRLTIHPALDIRLAQPDMDGVTYVTTCKENKK